MDVQKQVSLGMAIFITVCHGAVEVAPSLQFEGCQPFTLGTSFQAGTGLPASHIKTEICGIKLPGSLWMVGEVWAETCHAPRQPRHPSFNFDIPNKHNAHEPPCKLARLGLNATAAISRPLKVGELDHCIYITVVTIWSNSRTQSRGWSNLA